MYFARNNNIENAALTLYNVSVSPFDSQATKTVTEKSSWEEQVEPYRSDNAKLTRENNDLHLQLIRLKEESEATAKDLKVETHYVL